MRVTPWHQANWDARAAGNFIGGGSGSGLLLCAGLLGPQQSYRLSALLALALTGLGLLCVLAEIGRPWRAINVLRHPQTSWMTREAIIAPFLFLAGATAALMGGGPLAALAALIAAAYLYSQARMLAASKGIPAWRHPLSIPLMLATGIVEGAGLATLLALSNGIRPPALCWLLLLALFGRRIAWKRYFEALEREGAPELALAVLRRLRGPFDNYGQSLPELLLLAALLIATEQSWPLAAAGALAVLSGWTLKFILVTRAGYNQGFALPVLPIRGQGELLPGVKPGWSKPAAKDEASAG